MLGGTFSGNNVSNTGSSSTASYIPLYHMTATNVCILSSEEGGGRSSSGSKTSSVAIAAAATATAISALWLMHCSHRRKEEFAKARRPERKKTVSTQDDAVEVVLPFVAVHDKKEPSSPSLVSGNSGTSPLIREANNEEQEVQNDVQVNDVLPLPEVNATTEQGQNLEVLGSNAQTTQDNERAHERKEEETVIPQKEVKERAENDSGNKKLSLSLEENKSIGDDDEEEDEEGDDIFSISLPPFAMFSPIHRGGRLSTPTSNERGGDTFFWNDSSSICGSDKSLTINSTTDRRDDIESWQQRHQSCDMAFNDNVDENMKCDDNRSSNKIVKPKQKRSCSISLILQQNKHDDYESINFYLPKLNAWCKCDDCRTSILSQAKDHTILDLSNILRSWQVEFLSSQGIRTIDDLSNVKDDMEFLKNDHNSKGEPAKESKQNSKTEKNDETSSLCEAMVTWRVQHSDKQIVESQFNNVKACSVALHVWKKAAATLRESIYHQLSSPNKEMNWVPDLVVSGKWHNSSFRRQSSNISTTTVILPNDDDDDDDTTLTL